MKWQKIAENDIGPMQMYYIVDIIAAGSNIEYVTLWCCKNTLKNKIIRFI